jgi:hypothetical protein
MATIKSFNKPICHTLGLEIEAAVAAIAAKHGLKARYGGGAFDDAKFTCRLHLELSADNPNIEAVEQAQFNKWCDLYDLTPTDYGAKIKSSRFGELTLVGFEPSRPKFPIKVRKPDGSLSVFTKDLVRMLKAQRISAI